MPKYTTIEHPIVVTINRFNFKLLLEIENVEYILVSLYSTKSEIELKKQLIGTLCMSIHFIDFYEHLFFVCEN